MEAVVAAVIAGGIAALDLFGTAETARLLTDRIPDAPLTIYTDGGNIWLGHDHALTREIVNFVTETGQT